MGTRRSRALAGFTFIELLVTLAIMGTLAMLAAPMAELAVQRHKERELRSSLAEIRGAIDAYKRAADQGRIKVSASDSGYPITLETLVDGVEDERSGERKMIYFLRRLPRDPMYTDETAAAVETWGKRSYASSPDDPIEGDDVFDVFSMSDRVGINGIPYRAW